MPSSKSTLTSQEGKKFIKDYMKSQYRPFSANDIQLNLHNQVTKTKLVQILQELVVEKELIVKSVGKTNYYCYKELKVSFDSCIDIEQEISIETYLKELNKDIGVLNSEIQKLAAVVSNDALVESIHSIAIDIASCEKQLTCFNQENKLFNIEAAQSYLDTLSKMHNSRKKMFLQFYGTLREMMEEENILESCGIEEKELENHL